MRGRIVMINSRWTNHRDLHLKPSHSLRNYVIYMFVRTRLVHVDRYTRIAHPLPLVIHVNANVPAILLYGGGGGGQVDRVNDTVIDHLRNICSLLRKDR